MDIDYTRIKHPKKTIPVIKWVNETFGDLIVPKNINYMWNWGSILFLVLIIQIITGILLAAHYAPVTTLAFTSVELIMREVSSGWLLRYTHSNGASMFFIAIYMHVARGLYYGSYTKPREKVWLVGVILIFVLMATAFIGYVLPWGQMSYWGATVITNLVSAVPYIGNEIVIWLWGGYSVDNATLNRFFAFHFVLPFILLAITMIHIELLHKHGGNNPLGIQIPVDGAYFQPYFLIKDVLGYVVIGIMMIVLIAYMPNVLGHSDNYIEANPLVTPPHIVPEWYFLFAYAILRSIPSKLGGVIALAASIAILAILPYTHRSHVRSSKFRIGGEFIFWNIVVAFAILTWIGGNPVEDPYVLIGQLSTVYYFGLYGLTYYVSKWEDILMYINVNKYIK
jgi:ubiquinol-cytochrome c reductase cytochrome b subunit